MMIKIKENHGWVGKLRLIKKDMITGKIITNRLIFNRLMNSALNEVIKTLYGTGETDLLLKHVAIGDDDTANLDTMTTLVNEIYRVPIISKIKTGTGIITSTAILLDTEPTDLSGIVTIKEIGFFCGSQSINWTEGSGKDTGLMISRIVLDPVESKTATEQINFVREDEFTRG